MIFLGKLIVCLLYLLLAGIPNLGALHVKEDQNSVFFQRSSLLRNTQCGIEIWCLKPTGGGQIPGNDKVKR